MADLTSIISAVVIGLISGFLISIPVGPINLAIINEGAKRGFKWGVLIGFGAIGQQVARRLSGFNCTILAYDPFVSQSPPELPNVQILPREEVIRQSDFLSFHCALTAETKNMADARFLAQMKPGAFLINTARGELVDEGALFDALKGRKLRGAALDVFTHQPPGKDHPLLGLPQVITSPHMGAHTDSATNAMGWISLRECLAVLRGESPRHRVV